MLLPIDHTVVVAQTGHVARRRHERVPESKLLYFVQKVQRTTIGRLILRLTLVGAVSLVHEIVLLVELSIRVERRLFDRDLLVVELELFPTIFDYLLDRKLFTLAYGER